jgi:hypothetical protein
MDYGNQNFQVSATSHVHMDMPPAFYVVRYSYDVTDAILIPLPYD